jgi:hypothetical protein
LLGLAALGGDLRSRSRAVGVVLGLAVPIEHPATIPTRHRSSRRHSVHDSARRITPAGAVANRSGTVGYFLPILPAPAFPSTRPNGNVGSSMTCWL